MLPVLFSHERQSSYLRLCLVSWPVPMQDLLPPAEVSKSWVKASLRASSWSPEHKEGPRCVSPERSSPRDRDVFLEQYAFRDASLRPAAGQRWDSHFWHRPVSLLIDTYSFRPCWGSAAREGCHTCKLKWRRACSQHRSFFPPLPFIWTRLIILMLAR